MTAPPFDLTVLDTPDILSRLFHPRPEIGAAGPPGAIDLMIPVAEGVAVGACFHPAGKTDPTILFFHGNGEIVSDYHHMGPLYTIQGINFLPVDYRGYGRSGGSPTVSGMLQDCHAILDFTISWLSDRNVTGPLFVMGRSLGSASALELAARRQKRLAGLILESAFAYGVPLLELLGVSIEDEAMVEEKVFQHLGKIKQVENPVLIIHAEHDHIIPVTDGRTLFKACHSDRKFFLEIADADHNDIFSRGMPRYMGAICKFCKGTPEGNPGPANTVFNGIPANLP